MGKKTIAAVISLSKKREDINNPDMKKEADLDQLKLIYEQISTLNNPNAKSVLTLACRSAQTFVAKSILD